MSIFSNIADKMNSKYEKIQHDKSKLERYSDDQLRDMYNRTASPDIKLAIKMILNERNGG